MTPASTRATTDREKTDDRRLHTNTHRLLVMNEATRVNYGLPRNIRMPSNPINRCLACVRFAKVYLTPSHSQSSLSPIASPCDDRVYGTVPYSIVFHLEFQRTVYSSPGQIREERCVIDVHSVQIT